MIFSNQSRCYYYDYLFIYFRCYPIFIHGFCIFIWWLSYIYLAIKGIILCKRDRIKGSKFWALDNRPWKRTMGLVDTWDHHDFGKWGYQVFCWRVGLPRILFGAWGCHDFCWCVGLPWLLFGAWDYHDFMRVSLPQPYVRMTFICVCLRLYVHRFIIA